MARATEFTELIDLASERLGGAVLHANDEFFAEKENLLKADGPVWKEHDYTPRGKWMDGWETRRKRTPGHDFALIRLGEPGIIQGVVVDTSFFRGNFPESCSIEALSARPEADVDSLLSGAWSEVLPKSPLKGDSENLFPVDYPWAVSHVRLNIYPDGGVARLRVHGTVSPDWRRHGGLLNELDLAAVEHGGEVLQCSDMFFGPKHNLIMPGRAANMSDGWETRRRRGPGNDWVIVRLGLEGSIGRVEIDTSHFKGNYPDTASLEGRSGDGSWAEILPRTKMQGHTRHVFDDELLSRGPFTHVRLNVFPDGGVARLRVFGTATERAREDEAARRLNTLSDAQAAEELRACCGSRAWVEGMVKARPFAGWDALSKTADRIWSGLSPEDWMEAFRAHPRIGERGQGWSAQEQAALYAAGRASQGDGDSREAQRASRNVLHELAAANEQYEKRFGHRFIVCATGKSGEEMMANLQQRLPNSPEKEIRIAAEEQQKITRLRLRKLVT